MNKIIRKAVFPIAGLGSRFLPVTKAMPKELLPIVNKPLIHYAVEEAISAGIDTLIFVTGRNKRAIEDYFDSNLELETALRARGNIEQADMVRNILPKGVECIFVRQPEPLGLGHAVLCAERAVGNDAFAVLLADDFLVDTGDGAVSDLLSAYETTNKSQLSYIEINGPSISNYGVLIPGDRLGSVNGLFEKPNYKSAPSNMASIGRYILQPDIFDILRGINPGASGEIQLADAIHILAKKGEVEAVKLKGKRFDCGSVDGFVEATNYFYELEKTEK